MNGTGTQREAFADPLDTFRFLEACKVLPMTRRMLGERFRVLYGEYAGSDAARKCKGHLAGDVAFATYLQRRLRKERLYPRWVLDLLRYEKARLRAADPARHVVFCVFRYDISRLVRAAIRGEGDVTAITHPGVAVWWRPRRGSSVRYSVLTPPYLFKRH